MLHKTLIEILEFAYANKASDIHIVVDQPPIFRLYGDIVFSKLPVISAPDLSAMIDSMLNDVKKDQLKSKCELDFSYSYKDNFQLRVNVYHEKGNLSVTIRIMPINIGTLESLGLPDVVKEIITKKKGLIIVSGTAGSGKSTTLSYMIDYLNRTRKYKIITIEDPIEYIHHSDKSLVIQREVGTDTENFATALKYALRQDPDVVVIGEMRDPESITMALTTAETGHLVLTTVHSSNAVETINRVIDVYPAGNREQVLSQLAGSLVAIIAQTLIPAKIPNKRILATEILLGTMAIRNMVRQGSLSEIRGQLHSEDESGSGMHSLEQCLSELIRKDIITIETAKEYAHYDDLLRLPENAPKLHAVDMTSERNLAEAAKKDKEKILIFDYNDDNIKQMSTILNTQGFHNLTIVKQEKEIMDQIRAVKPDFIVLVLSVFNDCFKVCREIKSAPDIRSKVIIMATYLKPEDESNANRAGVDAFILRTPTYELLTKTFKKLNG